MARESIESAARRWQALELLQRTYRRFDTLLEDVFEVIGFDPPTWMQYDIAAYAETGPLQRMIQAQREQSKTTIVAAYVVYRLIHNPKLRALIISAGGPMAKEISTLIIRIIDCMPELECLRPDPYEGDRTSVEAFDVHYTLKGIDKSPSVACVGIFGTLQGKRADLLIADDVESTKNGMTATQRETLKALCRDFPDICKGDIIYIGTPQSRDSIYNELPALGFDVRIWTGRYPTPKQLPSYGTLLAPSLVKRMADNPELQTGGGILGDQGQVTDPARVSEETHRRVERAKGAADYQLQYMLSTELMDKGRHPLRTEDLLIMRLRRDLLPTTVIPGMTDRDVRVISHLGRQRSFRTVLASSIEAGLSAPASVLMAVDPAAGGDNADETGYAVVAFLNSTLFVLAAGGVPGGYEEAKLQELAEVAALWRPNRIIVEKNMGFGAFSKVWQPILSKVYQVALEDVMSSGQKELRIISNLGPIMGRGSLVINEDLLEGDASSCAKYDPRYQKQYSLIEQLTGITRTRRSLRHDDRLDALEIACRPFIEQMSLDKDEAAREAERAKVAAWMANPFQRPNADVAVQLRGTIQSRGLIR